jgi:hypothetical protein
MADFGSAVKIEGFSDNESQKLGDFNSTERFCNCLNGKERHVTEDG